MDTFNKEVTDMFYRDTHKDAQSLLPVSCLVRPVLILTGLRVADLCAQDLRITG